jgi:flavin reductase (DIM6/NTAB) family NADH-FMN oxidoreductase RutF
MTTTPQAVTMDDQLAFRRALGAFPSGVTAVCALVDGAPIGMAASSFTSLSLDPPLVSVAFGTASWTWARLRGAHLIGVSVLAAEHEDLCRALAAPGPDRFDGVEWTATPEGAVHIDGSALTLTCSIDNVVTVGDHDLAVFLVHDANGTSSTEPLVFHGSRFRRVVG